MRRRADIKVGFSCNNQCLFCAQGKKRSLFQNRTTEEVENILQNCALNNIVEVVFTGGEPTIREDILKLVSYAKSLNFRSIQIQSNGRMFSYIDFCKKMIDAGATEFSPAVHGHNAKIHDYLTNSHGSFNQTIQGIKNLKKLGQLVLTNTVITSCNYEYLPSIAQLLIDFNVDQFQFAFIHAVGTAAFNRDWIMPKMKKVMPFVKKGLALGIKAKRKVMTEAIPYCFMTGYENYIAENNIPSTKVFDQDLIIEDYGENRVTEGKQKGAQCKNCKHDVTCEGLWKEYPALYGFDELLPISKI